MHPVLLLISLFITLVNAQAPFRLAIIGSGIGGASLAHFLNSTKNREYQVTIYEQEADPGGRTRAKEIHGIPVDLGASIFIEENELVYNFSKQLGLDLIPDPFSAEEDGLTAFWNGKDVLWQVENFNWYDPRGWWQNVKLGWRFGYRTPGQVVALVKEKVDQFINIYKHTWASTDEILRMLGLEELQHISLRDYLVQTHNINPVYVDELVNAISRINYGTDVANIHALAGLISLAPLASGRAYAYAGGNQKLTRTLVETSGAKDILMGKKVRWVEKKSIGTQRCNLVMQSPGFIGPTLCKTESVFYVVTSTDNEHREFDGVVIAAPFDHSGIGIVGDKLFTPPTAEYQRLHVTIVRGNVDPSYFGNAEYGEFSTVLTQGEESLFVSLTQLNTFDDGTKLYKLFSYAHINDEDLSKIFRGWDKDSVERKSWLAYPKMRMSNWKEGRRLILGDGLWYLNAFEPAISCMETQAIVANNAANLIRNYADYGK